MGVGSAATRKVLIRVQGPTADPDDDELLEAKEVTNLEGVDCVEGRRPDPQFASSTARGNLAG